MAAAAFASLALTARGPLGLARVCGPRLHLPLDIAVAVALAAAPVVPALRPDGVGIVVVELAALAWVRVATLTRYAKASVVATGPGAGPAREVAGPARVQGSRAAGAAGARGAAVARGLGTLAGRSARRLPGAGDTLRSGSRQAGRHAARLRQGWRRPSD